MNRTQLEYDIVDAESIVGHGDITNITDKRKRSWNLFSIESFFIFSLRFRQPSIIQLIELKGHNTYLVELSMFNDARHLLGVKSFQLKRKDEGRIVEYKDREYVNYVEVKLVNNGSDKMVMGLNYLLFQGVKGQPGTIYAIPKKKEQKMIDKALHRTTEIDLEVIEIEKQKELSCSQPNLEIFIDEEEVKENIECNGQSYGKKIVGNVVDLSDDCDMGNKIPSLEVEEISCGYSILEFESNDPRLLVLQNVNRQWLELQRQMETELKVPENYRLSKQVTIKHLYKKTFFIEGLATDRKEMLKMIGLEYGATFVEQLVDNCVVVSPRAEGEKLKRNKRFRGYKFVTEDYIINIKRFNMVLNINDYLIR